MPDRDARKRLAAVRWVLVDLDGVVVRGRAPIGGAARFFREVAGVGLGWLILTNQSAPTRAELVARLRRIGIDARARDILCGAEMAATKVAEIAGTRARVLVVGEAGLREALRAAGLRLVRAGADVVVVGVDRRFSYTKLARAASEVRGGAVLVGTTPDALIPSARGVVPGGGPLIAAVAAAARATPVVVGKPSAEVVHAALARLGATPEGTAIVGDSLETDVPAGRAAGLLTVLVLTGATAAPVPAAARGGPDLVYGSLAEFGDALVQTRRARDLPMSSAR